MAELLVQYPHQNFYVSRKIANQSLYTSTDEQKG